MRKKNIIKSFLWRFKNICKKTEVSLIISIFALALSYKSYEIANFNKQLNRLNFINTWQSKSAKIVIPMFFEHKSIIKAGKIKVKIPLKNEGKTTAENVNIVWKIIVPALDVSYGSEIGRKC